MLKEVDTIVMFIYARYDDYFAEEMKSLRDEMGKPVFIILGLPGNHRNGMRLLTKSGVPSFTLPERAIKAVAAIVRYSKYRHQS